MKDDVLETLAAWGDRQNRDTAHLLDIAIAGTIDQLQGQGTVRLLPGRLEEIVPRIAPRVRDEDGAWIVTLLPAEGDLQPVNPADVLRYVQATWGGGGDEYGLSEFMRAASKPVVTLRDMENAGQHEFLYWLDNTDWPDAPAPVDNQTG